MKSSRIIQKNGINPPTYPEFQSNRRVRQTNRIRLRRCRIVVVGHRLGGSRRRRCIFGRSHRSRGDHFDGPLRCGGMPLLVWIDVCRRGTLRLLMTLGDSVFLSLQSPRRRRRRRRPLSFVFRFWSQRTARDRIRRCDWTMLRHVTAIRASDWSNASSQSGRAVTWPK